MGGSNAKRAFYSFSELQIISDPRQMGSEAPPALVQRGLKVILEGQTERWVSVWVVVIPLMMSPGQQTERPAVIYRKGNNFLVGQWNFHFTVGKRFWNHPETNQQRQNSNADLDKKVVVLLSCVWAPHCPSEVLLFCSSELRLTFWFPSRDYCETTWANGRLGNL